MLDEAEVIRAHESACEEIWRRKGTPSAVRDAVLVEDDFPNAEAGSPFPIKTRSTVTETHRYSRDSDGFEMLFDLDGDPDELVNLAVGNRDPAARSAALDATLDQMLRADDLTRTEPVSR